MVEKFKKITRNVFDKERLDESLTKVMMIEKLNYYRLKAVGLHVGCKPTKVLHQF
jgi:hypothetical protein